MKWYAVFGRLAHADEETHVVQATDQEEAARLFEQAVIANNFAPEDDEKDGAEISVLGIVECDSEPRIVG